MKQVRLGTVVAWALLAVVGVCLALAASWRFSGGTWERVETPSMGTVAPVGSLLWVKPVPFESLESGDFITFRPPGSKTTYSHLIKDVDAEGQLITGGKISGTDPWRLTEKDVIGQVKHNWFGAGWLVKAAPLLILGALVISAMVHYARKDWKLPVAILGAAIVLTAAIVIYRPLTRAAQLSFAPVKGGAHAIYVCTGLLPVRLVADEGADTAEMKPGEVGRVTSRTKNERGEYVVGIEPVVPWWFWVGIIVGCFSPAVWSVISGRRVDPEQDDAETEAEEPGEVANA